MRELPVFPISVHFREGKAPTERSGINRKKQLRKGALGDGDMSGQIPVVQLFMWTPSRHVQARSFFKGRLQFRQRNLTLSLRPFICVIPLQFG